jgi:hypothetical protein
MGALGLKMLPCTIRRIHDKTQRSKIRRSARCAELLGTQGSGSSEVDAALVRAPHLAKSASYRYDVPVIT